MHDKGEISTGKVVTIIIAVLVFVVVLYLIFQANILAWFNQLPDYGQEDRLVANAVIPDDSVRIGILAGGSQIYLQGKITGLYFVPATKGSRQSGKIYMDVPTSLSNLWGNGIEIGTITGYKISINSEYVTPEYSIGNGVNPMYPPYHTFFTNLKYLQNTTLGDMRLLNNAYLDKDYNLIYKYNKDLEADWDFSSEIEKLNMLGYSNRIHLEFKKGKTSYLFVSAYWDLKENRPKVIINLLGSSSPSSVKYSSSAEIKSDSEVTKIIVNAGDLVLIGNIADSKTPEELSRNIKAALNGGAVVDTSPDYAPSVEQINDMLYWFDKAPVLKTETLKVGESINLDNLPKNWKSSLTEGENRIFLDDSVIFIKVDKTGKVLEIYRINPTTSDDAHAKERVESSIVNYGYVFP